jgi:hypothetical protein
MAKVKTNCGLFQQNHIKNQTHTYRDKPTTETIEIFIYNKSTYVFGAYSLLLSSGDFSLVEEQPYLLVSLILLAQVLLQVLMHGSHQTIHPR